MADLARAHRLPALSRLNWNLLSGIILMAFVTAHLASHAVLLVSLDWAQPVQTLFMAVWKTLPGTMLLAVAALYHLGYALAAIYGRRTMRMAKWEAWQLALGLSLPLLLMTHIVGTRVSELMQGTSSIYATTLISLWINLPILGVVQAIAVVAVWVHACIGVHFWLRMRPRYVAWRPALVIAALLLPAFALAGFVSGGNQVLRAVDADPQYITQAQTRAGQTQKAFDRVVSMTTASYIFYAALIALPFGARAVRSTLHLRRRRPQLTLANGRRLPIRDGATVLETLRENGIPHASICGGRARCTTCRVLVTQAGDELAPPEPREARALARINASPGTRLACQMRPTSDMTVLPLLAHNAGALDGVMQGGLDGRERLITVLFVDLRGSTTLGEKHLPYDVMFLLNQFFHEMTQALVETRGHYSQFTGDGLMALYGLNEADPQRGAADAMRGAAAMLRKLDALNETLAGEARDPLAIGIGIHHAEAIVGSMGPPNSQIVSAIGDTVNVCARLEALSKIHRVPLIISEQAAKAAHLDVADAALQDAQVSGRRDAVRFYALAQMPAFES